MILIVKDYSQQLNIKVDNSFFFDSSQYWSFQERTAQVNYLIYFSISYL